MAKQTRKHYLNYLKLVRLYETRSIPDSLFDEATRQGLRAGLSLDLPYRTRIFGSFGIRFRTGDLQNTTSFSGGFSIRQILNSNLSLHTQISYFSTMFTEGYRPTVQLRLPVSRKLSADLGAGGYIYQIGQQTTSSYYLDGSVNYRVTQMLYVSTGNRMFIDKNLKSNRIFLEGGVTF